MLQLGNIIFGIDADLSGLQRAQETLQTFGLRVTNAFKGIKVEQENIAGALAKQEGVMVRSLQQVQNMASTINRMNVAPQVKAQAIEDLNLAMNQLVERMAKPVPLNTIEFQRAQLAMKEAFDAIMRSVKEAASAQQAGASESEAALRRQGMAAEKAASQYRMLLDAIERAVRAGSLSSGQGARLGGQAGQALSVFQGAVGGEKALAPEELQKAQIAFQEATTNIKRNAQEITSGISGPTMAFRALGAAAMFSMGPMSGIAFRMYATNQLIREFGVTTGIAAAGAIGLATGLVTLSEALIKVTIQFQQAEYGLRGMLGSVSAADGELAYLRKVSNETGLQFSEMTGSFLRFVASATAVHQGLSLTNDEFNQFAHIAGVMHLSVEQSNNVLRAFDQILSMGTVNGREMRQLFANLPGVFEAAADAASKMGVKFQDIMQQKKGGGVAGPEFLQFFIQGLGKEFNIDFSKPIDTLQASLGRVKNGFDLMILSLNNSIDASTAFKKIFNDLAGVMVTLSQHIGAVLQVIAAFVGALLGILAVVALRAALMGFLTLIDSIPAIMASASVASAILRGNLSALSTGGTAAAVGMTEMAAAEGVATGATGALTGATTALNLALKLNPIILVVSTILGFIAAIWGAKAASDAMAKSVQTNNTALADVSGIKLQLAMMIEQGSQVRALTTYYEQLLVAEEAALHPQIGPALAERAAAVQGLTEALKPRIAVIHGGEEVEEPADPGAIASAQERLRKANETVAGLHAQATSLTQAFGMLGQVQKLPDASKLGQARPQEGKTAGGGAAGDLQGIIDKAKDAKALLDAMFQGPPSEALIKAFTDASTKIDELNQKIKDGSKGASKEMGILLGMLADATAGTGIKGAVEQLTYLNAKIALAEEESKAFMNVWKGAHDAVDQLQTINAELDMMRHGGADNESMKGLLKSAEDAHKLLDPILNLQGSQLTAAFAQMRQQGIIDPKMEESITAWSNFTHASGAQAAVKMFTDLGYGVSHTGDAMKDATADAIALFNAIAQGNSHIAALEATMKEFNKDKGALQDAFGANQLVLSGNIGDVGDYQKLLKINDSLKAFYATADQQDIARLRQQFMDLNAQFNLGITNADSLAEMFKKVQDHTDSLTESTKAWTDLLDTQTKQWTDWGDSALDAINGLVEGTTTAQDALKKIALGLTDTIIKSMFLDPLKTGWEQFMQKVSSGQGGMWSKLFDQVTGPGIFGKQLGIGQGTTELTDLTKLLPGYTQSFGAGAAIANAGQKLSVDIQSIGGNDLLNNVGALPVQQVGQALGTAGSGISQIASAATKTLTTAASTTAKTAADTTATAAVTALATAATTAAAALTTLAASAGAAGIGNAAGGAGGLLSGLSLGGSAAADAAGFGVPADLIGLVAGGGMITPYAYSSGGPVLTNPLPKYSMGGITHMIPHYAQGGFHGIVKGSGGPTQDNVLARVSVGEFVTKASQTSKYLPLLMAINSGLLDSLPKAAMGGMIGPSYYSGGAVTSSDVTGVSSGSGGGIGGPMTNHIGVDARMQLVVQGNTDERFLQTMSQVLDLHKQQIHAEVPVLIDARLQDSLARGRYGGR